MDAVQKFALLISLTLAFLIIHRLLSSPNRKHLPPGPRGLPYIGNLLQLANTSDPLWMTLDQMRHKYGRIVYLNMAGQDIIVLNTKEVATDLLDRRSSIYSDRERCIVAQYLGSDLTIPFARYGKLWQNMRRASSAVLNARVSAQYHPVQTDEAVLLVHGLLYDSGSLLSKINKSATTIISVIYGDQTSYPVQKPNQIKSSSASLQLTSDALETMRNIAHRFTTALYPGAHLVETLPILDYLPPAVAKWKRHAMKDFEIISAIFERYFDDAVRNDDTKASLSVALAADEIALGMTNKEKAWIAGSLATSALETTSTTLSFFIYAMTLHPKVQAQAQIELDRVVGRSRNPTFADTVHLPYARAIVKEVLRWQPAIPLAVPHVVMEDDWYDGYYIPAGTRVIPSVWSMNRDTDIYGPNADEFLPERFLRGGLDGEKFVLREEFEDDAGHCAYGFGRRICVGRYTADDNLLISVATILWALRIELVNIPMSSPRKQKGTSKDILNPIPDFQCRFSPRFPEAAGVLQSLRDDILLARSNVSLL